MKQYYEAHVTMVGDPATIRPKVEAIGWKFSAIDGDPSLGPGVKCYATKFFNARLTEAAVVAILNVAAAALKWEGCDVVRRKVERVVFDDRSSTVGACDGACPGCHLDDLETRPEPPTEP